VKTFWGCQGGTTAIEYTLIAFLISIVIIASTSIIGTHLSGFFSSVTFDPPAAAH
jgi:Flp pilus assembly pilin Flp